MNAARSKAIASHPEVLSQQGCGKQDRLSVSFERAAASAASKCITQFSLKVLCFVGQARVHACTFSMCIVPSLMFDENGADERHIESAIEAYTSSAGDHPSAASRGSAARIPHGAGKDAGPNWNGQPSRLGGCA
jgi:hypothetical protein